MAQTLVISEFMASNQQGLTDEDGDHSDWIEIFNTGNQNASLLGWYLSDDASELTKWQFPEVNIPSESAIIVYASGKNRSVAGSELHTNFKLSKAGGYLGLAQPDGINVSHAYHPEYPIQLTDVSYGITMHVEKTVFIASDSQGRIHFPESDEGGLEWTLPSFDDAAWRDVIFGVGYIHNTEEGDSNAPGNPVPPNDETLLLVDVTFPTDFLEPTSLLSPVGESVEFAIDNNSDTKYLNFDTLNAGFTVELSRGQVAVTGLRLTSANDAPDRDPASFVISGSNNGTSFQEIARGAVPFFGNRFETVQIDFENDSAYSHYRLVFPTVRDAAVAVAMQIVEVELLGWIPEGEVDNPGDPDTPDVIDLTRLEDISAPDDTIEPTTNNSPVNEEVWHAIDNIAETKYLNFDGPNSGFMIQPAVGLTVVNGLRLTSANDAPGRDPASYLLEGSQNGIAFELISQGDVPVFDDRFTAVEIAFNNNKSFEYYRLTFPNLRGGSGQLMQVAEVEFLGRVGLPQPTFGELIHTDLKQDMYDRQSSIYARIPFTISEGVDLQGLTLGMRYDDGFIAYINGVEVARANAPALASFDSVALSDRDPRDAAAQELFDLDHFSHLLNSGKNVLAVHAMNDRPASPDFLLEAQLEISVTRVNLTDAGYFESPSPGRRNSEAQIGIVPAPLIHAESGFLSSATDVAIQSELEGVRIYYTTNGTTPDALTSPEYTQPIHVDATTVLRAAAFREGWRPSPVSTRTYLFTADIANQSAASGPLADFPDHWGSQVADYDMDPRVVGQSDGYGGRYTASIQNDLLSIPSISLVMETDDLFGPRGIYANPNSRGSAWEKPVSIELIYPDDRKGFQENAGIRIQGGAFRRFDLSLKKSFRLVFKNQYGSPTLKFPLFGPDAAASFDNLVLRANGNDAWPYGGDRALYVRDAFAMETARAMGMVSSHTTFVHLYLNGAYWGLYNLVERPDAAFSAEYHGGDKDTWDALNQDSVPDGTRAAWDRMLAVLNEGIDRDEIFQKIQGKNPQGMRDPAIENLLDIENLIDYCILNFYIGNQDWPGRNYWVGRDREGDEGFQFYPWDSETAMGMGSGLNANQTGVNTAVATPYGALRANSDFRRWFGDRVQRHFFPGGALYVNPASPTWTQANPENNVPAARFAALAERVDQAIVGESARWGDQLAARPYTRDEDWRKERDNLLINYFPRRAGIVLEQLRQAGLYPRTKAPTFNLPSGKVAQGSILTMNASGGTIYYTLDGTDPRTDIMISTVRPSVLVDESTQKRVIIPSTANGGNAFGNDWYLNADFPDSNWILGTGGIGYDAGAGYQNLIEIDVLETMNGENGSAFIRVPFEVESETMDTSNFMVLRMRYDDGFVAYLNGVRIASANAPEILEWNSFATAGHDDAAAVFWEEFEVSTFLENLRPGENLLAIQGLNVSSSSSDFLIDVELMVGQRNITGNHPTANRYTSPIALQDLTTIKASALSGSEWSALNEATFIVGETRLAVSELHYHPADPSMNEIESGFVDGDAFEFIELYNPGTVTFPLDGVNFVDGISFDFTGSKITQLAPNATVLVVKNLAAFELRYGHGLPVAGEYSGNFSNAGETVIVMDSDNEIMISFSYSDDDAQLKSADGGGASLVAIDIENDPEPGVRWKTSDQVGGSPGTRAEPFATELKPTIRLEEDLILIECPVTPGRLYGLFSAEGLDNTEWSLLVKEEQINTEGISVFEVPISGAFPSRFFQIREIVTLP